MRHLALSITVSVGLALASCDSDNERTEPVADGGSDAGVSANQVSGLTLEKPKRGFQVRSQGADIASGEDIELCEVAQLPGDPDQEYYVNRLEFANRTGSHHLIVNAAVPGSPAERKLEVLGVGNRVPCLGIESEFGSDSFVPMGGSQQPYADISLPKGVGRLYRGGQLFVFDYHYYNVTEQTIRAESAVNVHLTDASTIDNVAAAFGFNNYLIATEPGEEASFVGECHFKSDVMLAEITRHTHRWGTDFTVWYSGGERDGEEIWRSDDWQHATQYTFDEPVRMRAGEGLRFRCGFQNDTKRALRFGTSATDEMCILFGTAWATEKGAKLPSQSCIMVWQDSGGIGHPASEAGGFPKPTAAQTESCLGGSPDTDCARCRCDACAPSVMQCAGDADCSAITRCYAECEPGTDCAATCQDTIDSHSSAVGLLTQTSHCTQSRCAEACQQ
jgi:hypothetical protein